MPEDMVMVEITKAEYDRLKEDSEWLGYLNAAGVDNWDGCSYAYEMKEENDKGE